ncbi:ABC transporter domain-containing protein [Ditylenchus destructor]|uniref:ABC transporter domain-containing protein n=1 Tax=Ditylenchus destructor TaxID=166010 RepID=A0AAD4QWB4_9BILA|nr:ABC transporter domain-containing protein [Ditylenchus destructor]
MVIIPKLSLCVEEGDFIGVIGPNGAGKSTMFGLISAARAVTAAASCSTAWTSPRWMRRSVAAPASGAPSRFRSRSRA